MRLVTALTILLAGCAAPQPRFMVLESELYACGAAEGLGCGLLIMPVLHSIDDLEGVAESRVSWDGRHFRIELLPDANFVQVSAAASALMEGEATCVAVPRGKATDQPDRWFNAEQTVELSRYEAGVIASDFAEAIAAEVDLEPGAVERMHTVLREELEHAFEQAHAEGGGVHRLWEQIPTAQPRLEARLAEFLTPSQSQQVSAILSREIFE